MKEQENQINTLIYLKILKNIYKETKTLKIKMKFKKLLFE